MISVQPTFRPKISPDLHGMQVKPVYLDGVLEALSPHITPDHLIISIVAGVKLGVLESNLPESTRLVCHLRFANAFASFTSLCFLHLT